MKYDRIPADGQVNWLLLYQGQSDRPVPTPASAAARGGDPIWEALNASRGAHDTRPYIVRTEGGQVLRAPGNKHVRRFGSLNTAGAAARAENRRMARGR